MRKHHHVTGTGITLQGLMITSHDQRTSPKEAIENKAWNSQLLWFAYCSVGIVVLMFTMHSCGGFLFTIDLCKLFFKQNCKVKIKGDGGELKVTECVEGKKSSWVSLITRLFLVYSNKICLCLLIQTFKIEISKEKVTLLLLLLIFLTPSPYPTQKIDFIVIFNEVRYLTNSSTMLLHIKVWSGNFGLDDYY